MKHRLFSSLALVTFASACGGGPPSPPALAYDAASSTSVVYDYEDNTVVSISFMGQSMEMSQEGVADYAVTFDPDPDGVVVTLTVGIGAEGVKWGLLAAAGVLTIIPGALVVYFVRNYMAKGFALGRV